MSISRRATSAGLSTWQVVRRISDKLTMKELQEQRVCVCVCVCVWEREREREREKVCCKLGKILQRHFNCLNQASGEDCMSRTQCYEWFNGFQNVGRWRSQTWTTFHINRRRPCRESSRCDSWKSSFNCPRSCWRCGHQHRILPSNFDMKNYRCVASVQNSCRVCWLTIRKRTVLKSVRNRLPM